MIPIRLIFYDWTKCSQSVYNAPEGVDLSLSDFHSGTMFRGTIELDEEQLADFRDARAKGYLPAFLIQE